MATLSDAVKGQYWRRSTLLRRFHNMSEHNDLQKVTAEADTIAQRHGGALLPGGKVGNPGGIGMAPSIVRDRARRGFYERINELEALADRTSASDRDRIRAIDTLGKYGLSTGRLDIEEVRVRLAKTLHVISELADPDTAERILKAIDPIWHPNNG